MNYGILAFRR